MELDDIVLTVAVRLRSPLVGSAEALADRVDDLIISRYGSLQPITPDVAAAVRSDFVGPGYDGLMIHDADEEGADYVVAFFGASVKVVQA